MMWLSRYSLAHALVACNWFLNSRVHLIWLWWKQHKNLVCIIVSKEMQQVTETDRASDLQCYVTVKSWRLSQCSPIALPYIFYLLGIVWKSLLHHDYILSSWIFSMFCKPILNFRFLIVTPCMTFFTSHMTSGPKYLCASSWQNWCHSETDIVDGELPGDDCRMLNGPGDSIEKACAL
jgi:hypothetical protein